MSDLIMVQFRSKTEPLVYAGKEYAYRTLIDVEIGDLVVVPVRNELDIARVSAINVPESKVDERIMPFLKTVEKKWEKPI